MFLPSHTAHVSGVAGLRGPVGADCAARGGSRRLPRVCATGARGAASGGSLTDLSGMFQYATVFNGDIGGWSTRSDTNLSRAHVPRCIRRQPGHRQVADTSPTWHTCAYAFDRTSAGGRHRMSPTCPGCSAVRPGPWRVADTDCQLSLCTTGLYTSRRYPRRIYSIPPVVRHSRNCLSLLQ
jgi:hypothetical protein